MGGDFRVLNFYILMLMSEGLTQIELKDIQDLTWMFTQPQRQPEPIKAELICLARKVLFSTHEKSESFLRTVLNGNDKNLKLSFLGFPQLVHIFLFPQSQLIQRTCYYLTAKSMELHTRINYCVFFIFKHWTVLPESGVQLCYGSPIPDRRPFNQTSLARVFFLLEPGDITLLHQLLFLSKESSLVFDILQKKCRNSSTQLSIILQTVPHQVLESVQRFCDLWVSWSFKPVVLSISSPGFLPVLTTLENYSWTDILSQVLILLESASIVDTYFRRNVLSVNVFCNFEPTEKFLEYKNVLDKVFNRLVDADHDEVESWFEKILQENVKIRTLPNRPQDKKMVVCRNVEYFYHTVVKRFSYDEPYLYWDWTTTFDSHDCLRWPRFEQTNSISWLYTIMCSLEDYVVGHFPDIYLWGPGIKF